MSTAVDPGQRQRQAVTRAGLRPPPWAVALPAFVILAVATLLMLRRAEPFVNYYYISAWYPTILILDAAQARRSGRYYLLARPGFAFSLLGWSAVLWFFFELVNFRVTNWYYIFLPPERPIRWLGTTVSFATVFPAIFLAQRWLAVRDAFVGVRWPTFEVTRRTLITLLFLGVAFAGLSLAWPMVFFPMIWGALTLLLEPWNYSRDPSRSLLGDLSAGRPGRLLRLLVGGMAIGLLWEMFNIESRSKWIYTVPGLENFKLFEMPLLGFFGFPVFALDCFVVYQSLLLAGVAMSERPGAMDVRLRPGRTAAAALLAVVFSLAVLVGMDRWNTDSLRPTLQGLWLASAAERESLASTPYRNPFVLAESEPAEVARATGAAPSSATEWVAASQIMTLRGIGTSNARLLWEAGVRSLPDLARSDPDELGADLRRRTERPHAATPAKVRVWVRAAQKATPD
jgi:hypothetical protein